MLSAVSGRYTNTVAYTFDPAGRKASEALTISSVTYTIGQAYNARNELTTVTYPDSSTSTRSYHSTGALNELAIDGSTISTRSYDAGRRQTTEVLGNGITETRSYRSDNLLSGISYSNTSLGDLSYTWDANKNKTSETVTGVMSGYGFTSGGTTYDFEDRLTGYARASGTFNQSWNLTSVGDWTSVTTNGIAQNRTHGPTHELLTAGGSSVVTDVKGNMTSIPATLRPAGATTALLLSWDFDNKLASADIDANGTADVSFQYDALGRRVARTGTGGSFVFVQMDQQTIADYPVGGAASTPTYRYVYASYIDEPVVRKTAGTGGTLVYFHRNQQYSVTAITTSTGAIAERYAYSAYGQPTILDPSGITLPTSNFSIRTSYTGREWDATLGLHHFRARWMSPNAGRFLSRDPIGYFDRVGLYECGLRLNALDPRGLSVERKLSCEEFLLNVEFLDITGWPSDAKKQFQGGAQVFCGACTPYQNYSWNVNGRCTICLGNATKYYSQEWEAALIHELTHCEQSKCFGKGAPREVLPLPLPPPRFGAPSDKACFDCRSLEGKAWQAQCGHLFPDDAAKRNQCIEAGKCYSCKFACSQTQGIVKKCKNVAFPNFTPKEIPLTSTPLTPPIVPIDPPDYSKLPLWNFPDPKL